VRLWIASDAPDTDFTVKLDDVYPPSADLPDGFAMTTIRETSSRPSGAASIPTLMQSRLTLGWRK
jgi:predicted acyl esterase